MNAEYGWVAMHLQQLAMLELARARAQALQDPYNTTQKYSVFEMQAASMKELLKTFE